MADGVLIVDDQARFRAWAESVLTDAGFAVVGQAADGAGAISAVARMRPEVVLLDVGLPDIDGFAVASQMRAGRAPPTIVLTSSRDASDYGPLIADSGALGFIPKSRLSGATLARVLAARDLPGDE